MFVAGVAAGLLADAPGALRAAVRVFDVDSLSCMGTRYSDLDRPWLDKWRSLCRGK
jgi:hypothetical protein